MLALDSVRLERGGRVMAEGLSLAIRPGEVTVLLGPNGAGKSTLLETMAGLRPPAAGTVHWAGMPIADMAAGARARAIGYLPQGGVLHWNLAVRETVALGRLPHRGRFGGEGPADRAAVDAALGAADLEAMATRRAAALSGGERARVLLARVLAGGHPLILADEPLANLDPRHQRESLRLLRGAARNGAAVVLVVHDLAAAANAGDRLLLLDGRRLLADGSPREVMRPDLLAAAYGVPLAARHDPELGWVVGGPAL